MRYQIELKPEPEFSIPGRTVIIEATDVEVSTKGQDDPAYARFYIVDEEKEEENEAQEQTVALIPYSAIRSVLPDSLTR